MGDLLTIDFPGSDGQLVPSADARPSQLQVPPDRYAVTVRRTETITFELEADSPADARERCLMDGEETASRTCEVEVVDVQRA